MSEGSPDGRLGGIVGFFGELPKQTAAWQGSPKVPDGKYQTAVVGASGGAVLTGRRRAQPGDGAIAWCPKGIVRSTGRNTRARIESAQTPVVERARQPHRRGGPPASQALLARVVEPKKRRL